ncbi:hypothetical protein J6590_055063 [Homalodisca vitripennis]|nr:hypothetical protein J6590_055063 [Homalodisca vitripennis]
MITLQFTIHQNANSSLLPEIAAKIRNACVTWQVKNFKLRLRKIVFGKTQDIRRLAFQMNLETFFPTLPLRKSWMMVLSPWLSDSTPVQKMAGLNSRVDPHPPPGRTFRSFSR